MTEGQPQPAPTADVPSRAGLGPLDRTPLSGSNASTTMSTTPHYQRVLLKISGESFATPGGFGIDDQELKTIAQAIVEAAETGTDIGVVVGGGNMIRGADLARDIGIERS